ncbi:ATPase [Paenibacillus thiaminolyticus]|uniref:ATPase n=1 Tax=Paenibacillus thiaminolyticus TaxID=49283 RepID=UPI0035A6F9EB
MRRLAIGLALMIPVAGYAEDADGWAAGEEPRSQLADAVKEHIPGSPQHVAEIHQR